MWVSPRTGEGIWIHAHAEGTDEDLPVHQGHQDPNHGGQQGSLEHGGEQKPKEIPRCTLF